MNRSVRLLILFTFSALLSFGQRLKKADRTLVANLKSHITYLADDKLEGRRAGTKGEQLAATYISSHFQKIGLTPKGDNSTWLQTFSIYDGKQVNSSTHLIINGHDLKLNKDFFPLAYSASSSTEAAVATALAERGVPWFRDLKDELEENKDNPHYDLNQSIADKAKQAAEKGATALIVYNSSDIDDGLKFLPKDRTETASIPVLYLTREAAKQYLADESATLDLKLKVDLGEKTRKGNNVIGYLDNGASNTIIIGAHYDHLGYGEDGGSLHIVADKSIHNGADDNASGTAGLIELARLLKNSKKKNSNYLFIAFSGEELGLYGSKYFTEHPTVDLSNVNYMINMDMIGRLNANSKTLTVGGYGTSPAWGDVFNSIKDAKQVSVRFDSTGAGPSDHTSFYRKDIPVLFFFTGVHSDYHKPSDDQEKINYTGELYILRYITEVIEKAGTKGKLAFAKTREPQMGTSARFSVTLGIMPDYTFSGTGVKVDGISSGKAAEKAGMKAGDIIVQLGEHNTSSLESYMQALSKFKKGDKTRVKYKRAEETHEADVEF